MKSKQKLAPAAAKRPEASATTAPLRIALADDHVLMRDLLSAMLSTAAGYEVVAEVSTTSEVIEVCERLQPDLLVLDVNMPGQSGIEAIPAIKNIAPQTRVLVCCSAVNQRELTDALGAGADGFMEKTSSRSDFVEAIARVARGGTYLCIKSVNVLSAALRHPVDDHNGDGFAQLTVREKEILALIANGHSSKEIAAQLFVSVTTVDTHRSNLMGKIGAHNVAQVIRYALDHGMVAAARVS